MRLIYGVCCLLILSTCSGNSEQDQNCRFLLDIDVQETVNLSLPQFSQLLFPSNSVYIPNVGNGGIILVNTGTGFAAYDAADPNRAPSTCSILQPNGVIAESSCEDKNRYDLINGIALEDGNLRCPLRRYRVEQNGNTLLIFN